MSGNKEAHCVKGARSCSVWFQDQCQEVDQAFLALGAQTLVSRGHLGVNRIQRFFVFGTETHFLHNKLHLVESTETSVPTL